MGGKQLAPRHRQAGPQPRGLGLAWVRVRLIQTLTLTLALTLTLTLTLALTVTLTLALTLTTQALNRVDLALPTWAFEVLPFALGLPAHVGGVGHEVHGRFREIIGEV